MSVLVSCDARNYPLSYWQNYVVVRIDTARGNDIQ
jgi:hypothetical protein